MFRGELLSPAARSIWSVKRTHPLMDGLAELESAIFLHGRTLFVSFVATSYTSSRSDPLWLQSCGSSETPTALNNNRRTRLCKICDTPLPVRLDCSDNTEIESNYSNAASLFKLA